MATFKHPDLPGQLVTYPDDAADTLAASGWVNVNAPTPEPEPEPELASYAGWLKADLVAEAESRGLDTTGTKDDLIARLDGNDLSATEPDQPPTEA